jgi:hypothetical protein
MIKINPCICSIDSLEPRKAYICIQVDKRAACKNPMCHQKLVCHYQYGISVAGAACN